MLTSLKKIIHKIKDGSALEYFLWKTRIKKVTFESIQNNENIYLYAGDLTVAQREYDERNWYGLSIIKSDKNHIYFDITNKFPLKDNSVDVFCAEDVMEHIEYEKQLDIFNEIYRILKPNGVFRFSVPDFRCDLILQRTLKNKKGELMFDTGGGGKYSKIRRKVIKGGHVWFPVYESVKKIFDLSNFEEEKVNFLHFYKSSDSFVLKDIDYSICFIRRTPDNDPRTANPRRPMSLVVDATK
tara:strand:+ start:825 stop:1547 length:723 start_codon:yes stop_codon:yes gene_type:complete